MCLDGEAKQLCLAGEAKRLCLDGEAKRFCLAGEAKQFCLAGEAKQFCWAGEISFRMESFFSFSPIFLDNHLYTNYVSFDLHFQLLFALISFAGTSKGNRDKVVESLNLEYQFLVNKDFSMKAAYEKMVATRPRKVLSKHDYNNHGAPFRSARCVEPPKETDVSALNRSCCFFLFVK